MLTYNPLQHNGEAGLVRFIDEMLADASFRKASDIHIEPMKGEIRIRYRIDGKLELITSLPSHCHANIISRLKILSGLDIAERRLPQDGKFQIQSQFIDCRLSTCITIHGEKAVIRLLNTNQKALSLKELGMMPEQQRILKTAIQQTQGLILVTGPTGSGKTFTLYSILNALNKITKNIVTVEDPVEIQLNGICQTNIQTKANLSFAKILRAFLRQDPDIIMVGEIRDSETAGIALKAAQTGHLVLATLHTNSAMQAITRLRDMGVADYLLAHSITLILSQRLVKRQDNLGRIGEFELLQVNDKIRHMILQRDYEAILNEQKTIPVDCL